MSREEYDLTGVHGAEHYRSLAPGVKLRLNDGAICEITANPGDGAYLLVKVVEDAANPDRVGEDEVIYFTEVEGVYVPTESAS